MANTIKQFDFKLIGARKGPDGLRQAFDPHVVIELKKWGHGDDGAPSISPTLASASEIDEHVLELKCDLDAVAARAKRAIDRERSAILADIKRRSENKSSEK